MILVATSNLGRGTTQIINLKNMLQGYSINSFPDSLLPVVTSVWFCFFALKKICRYFFGGVKSGWFDLNSCHQKKVWFQRCLIFHFYLKKITILTILFLPIFMEVENGCISKTILSETQKRAIVHRTHGLWEDPGDIFQMGWFNHHILTRSWAVRMGCEESGNGQRFEAITWRRWNSAQLSSSTRCLVEDVLGGFGRLGFLLNLIYNFTFFLGGGGLEDEIWFFESWLWWVTIVPP